MVVKLRESEWLVSSVNLSGVTTVVWCRLKLGADDPYVRATCTARTYGCVFWCPYVRASLRPVDITRMFSWCNIWRKYVKINWKQKCLWWDEVKIAARRNRCCLLQHYVYCLRRRSRKCSCWARKWITRRYKRSISNTLVREVQMEDESEFRSMFRMNKWMRRTFNFCSTLWDPL